MKIRKITAFIVAVLSVFATFTTLPKVTKVSAANEIVFVQGFKYSSDYILSKLFVEQEGDETKATGFTYASSNPATENPLESHTFLTAGTFEYNLFHKVDNVNTLIDRTTGAGYYAATTFKVVSSAEANAEIKYTVKKTAYDAYVASVYDILTDKQPDGSTKEPNPKKLNDTIEIPYLSDELVNFTYYSYSELRKTLGTSAVNSTTLYYCAPQSSSFASSSSRKITLSKVGTYKFYFELKDSFGNALTVDKEALTQKEDGWYDESDNLVAPIFSFEFYNVQGPEVTIEKDITKYERGFINLAYNDLSSYRTIVANNEQVDYQLWYYPSSDAASGLEAGYDVTTWIREGADKLADTATAKRITDEEEFKFDKSTLSFVPTKAGHYYLVITVGDDYGADTVVTWGVSVHEKFTPAKYETQFLKNNWLSFMFLGIALLSLIGIILIIFIKPKEEEEEEVNEVAKK
ncbi:MAG: hypothetical protein IKJ19_04775 [Clostridia bacterium]|nr:hypothetical protein [Clostridia bacterium]